MSVPSNSALEGGSWSPERELTESAPRRYAPSPYPDLNQPNALLLLGLGGLLLVVGMILFFVSSVNHDSGAKDLPYIAGGAVFAIGGAIMVSLYPAKLKAHRDRAANLVENGAPVMARIVKVDNETGDSKYGRIVTYMVTLPGATEETHREVKVDDRQLPNRIPGPVTALLDFRTSDIELYCALPYVAMSKFGATAPAAAPGDLTQAGLPTQAPARPTMPAPQAPRQVPDLPLTPPVPPAQTPGDMAPLGAMGTQAPPPPEPDTKPKEPKRAAPADTGAAKLPWEK